MCFVGVLFAGRRRPCRFLFNVSRAAAPPPGLGNDPVAVLPAGRGGGRGVTRRHFVQRTAKLVREAARVAQHHADVALLVDAGEQMGLRTSANAEGHLQNLDYYL